MPHTVTQLQVVNQTSLPGGHETCGYHTLKNSVLALMRLHNMINDEEFKNLRKDVDFFKELHKQTVQYQEDRYVRGAFDDLRRERKITPLQFTLIIDTERVLYERVFNACYDNLQYKQGHIDASAIIASMHERKVITDEQFELLKKDSALLDTINAKVIHRYANRNSDLSVTQVINLLQRIQKGEFKIPGISNSNLGKLKLTSDGTEEITVVNYMLDINMPGHGLGGMEEDLLAAATTAKLARTKGATQHAFALGLNNMHWITAVVIQNDKGERTWQIMDSYHNQDTYNKTVTNLIEAVLTKSEKELKAYLVQAYDNAAFSIEPFSNRLNPFTGLPYDDNEEEVKEYFKNGAEGLATKIENRLQFMRVSGWLEAPNDEEKQRIQSLKQIADFLYVTTQRPDIKRRLEPICNALNNALAPPAVDEVNHEVIHGHGGVNVVVDDKANQPITVGGDKKDGPAVDVKEPKVDINDKKETPIVPVDKPKVKKPKINIEPPKPKIIGEDIDDKPKDKAAKQKQDEDIKIQQRQAGDAVKNGTPKPTESLISQLVKGIKFLWEGIKSAVEYVARAIGIVQ